MRIAHLSDIHIDGSETASDRFAACLKTVHALNPCPDLIIFGGDIVRDALVDTPPLVEQQWLLFADLLKKHNTIPYVHCLGNHDIAGWEAVGIAKQLALRNMGIGKSYYSLDFKHWQILLLDSNHLKKDGTWYEARIDTEQYQWLEQQLVKNQDKHILVVSHIPILSACVFFDGENVVNDNWHIPGAWMHLDAKKLVDLLSRFAKVKLCVSGHLHLQEEVKYNNIGFYCNGAVSGSWWKGKNQQTEPGFALIDLTKEGTYVVNYLTY